MKLFSRSGLRALCVGWAAAVLLAGCGGGGSSSAPVASPGAAPNAFANMCSLQGEKLFTRAYLEEAYLWYDEIPAVNACRLQPARRVFLRLAHAPAGHIRAAEGPLQLHRADGGRRRAADRQQHRLRRGLGNGHAGPAARRLRRSGLARAGLGPRPRRRTGAGPEPDANWFPNAPASISFIYRSAPGAATQTITLASAAVQEDPVPLQATLASPAGRKVAYLLFNAHTSGAQDKLIPAVQAAQAAGAQDLVLDMRYNGGGYLYVAQTLSAMLSGPAADGQVFEQLRYNKKRQAETDASAYLFSGVVETAETVFAAGTPLPRLALPRVFVLTSGSTCSASESVINSLRGIGVQVVLIGQTTCGKPYGFSERDNCGFAYFPIEFQGVNAQGFGDYATGFTPTCTVPDDFEHALGAANERLLSAALTYIDTGACPATTTAAAPAFSPVPGVAAQRPPVRGKVLLPAR